ncbi:MAG: disulfide bond formation protein B [Candidatus Liptonbacteria bacterium]|nr:disulfide bond formation protein B [Candidatus Liptonbacteria bacterium]
MNPIISFVSQLIGLLTIVSQFLILAIFYLLMARDQKRLTWISKYGLGAALVVALSSIFGSHFYSDIAGFPPCELCWLQRLTMYVLVIVLSLAVWRKSVRLINSILPLLGFGVVVAAYQSLLQYNVISGSICDILNTAVSCSKRYVFEFGYITIPLMSLTAFVLMFLFVYLSKSGGKSHN